MNTLWKAVGLGKRTVRTTYLVKNSSAVFLWEESDNCPLPSKHCSVYMSWLRRRNWKWSIRVCAPAGHSTAATLVRIGVYSARRTTKWAHGQPKTHATWESGKNLFILKNTHLDHLRAFTRSFHDYDVHVCVHNAFILIVIGQIVMMLRGRGIVKPLL